MSPIAMTLNQTACSSLRFGFNPEETPSRTRFFECQKIACGTVFSFGHEIQPVQLEERSAREQVI
jgi:hypothetical protein